MQSGNIDNLVYGSCMFTYDFGDSFQNAQINENSQHAIKNRAQKSAIALFVINVLLHTATSHLACIFFLGGGSTSADWKQNKNYFFLLINGRLSIMSSGFFFLFLLLRAFVCAFARFKTIKIVFLLKFLHFRGDEILVRCCGSYGRGEPD